MERVSVAINGAGSDCAESDQGEGGFSLISSMAIVIVIAIVIMIVIVITISIAIVSWDLYLIHNKYDHQGHNVIITTFSSRALFQ